jgi:hypothetical protein
MDVTTLIDALLNIREQYGNLDISVGVNQASFYKSLIPLKSVNVSEDDPEVILHLPFEEMHDFR